MSFMSTCCSSITILLHTAFKLLGFIFNLLLYLHFFLSENKNIYKDTSIPFLVLVQNNHKTIYHPRSLHPSQLLCSYISKPVIFKSNIGSFRNTLGRFIGVKISLRGKNSSHIFYYSSLVVRTYKRYAP